MITHSSHGIFLSVLSLVAGIAPSGCIGERPDEFVEENEESVSSTSEEIIGGTDISAQDPEAATINGRGGNVPSGMISLTASLGHGCTETPLPSEAFSSANEALELGAFEGALQSSVPVANGQKTCKTDCGCPLGRSCEAGICALPPPPDPFGPLPPEGICFATCQCPSGEYCAKAPSSDSGICQAPEFRYVGTGDTGVPHPILVRSTVTGPPGAAVRKYNRHVSCGSSAQWWEDTSLSGSTIGSGGGLEITYPLTSPLPCDLPILGRWESYFVVDGMASNIAEFTYYNSQATCISAVRTRAAASNYCPGSPCNGLGCPASP
jgi:hypothetical protein